MLIEIFKFQDCEYIIKIGQNQDENWDLISSSKQEDIWFHLGDDMASPHVILEMPKQDKNKSTKVGEKNKIHPAIIFKCSVLCKENSKFKNQKLVSVIYTEIKNVTKAERVGSVYTKKTKQLKV